jgi:hypothetical protein
VIPDGCKGGTVNCQITIPATNQSTTKSYSFNDFAPYPASAVPAISGNNLICSNEPYSIINVPNLTSSVHWSINSFASVTSGQGTSNVILNPSGTTSGNATIGVTMAVGNCAPFPLVNKNVWVGKPELYFIAGPNHVQLAFYSVNYVAVPYDPLASAVYTWSVSPTCHELNAFNWDAFITFPYDGDYLVSLSAQNACGQTAPIQKFVSVGIYEPYSIFPNPASDSFTLSIVEDNPEKSIGIVPQQPRLNKSMNAAYTIKILNSFGHQVYFVKTKNKEITIPISNLKDGGYIVVVNDGKNSFRKQLLVRRK